MSIEKFAIVTELKKLAKEAGIEIEEPGILCKNGHYKIKGKLLVNYYPLSVRKTAYVDGTTKGIKHVTPAQAIAMSMTQPEIAVAHIKDSRSRNSRKLRKKMLKGRARCKCHWCETMIDLDTSTVEHVIPLDRGGLNNANNRVLACSPCNNKRGNSMPEIAEMKANKS